MSMSKRLPFVFRHSLAEPEPWRRLVLRHFFLPWSLISEWRLWSRLRARLRRGRQIAATFHKFRFFRQEFISRQVREFFARLLFVTGSGQDRRVHGNRRCGDGGL